MKCLILPKQKLSLCQPRHYSKAQIINEAVAKHVARLEPGRVCGLEIFVYDPIAPSAWRNKKSKEILKYTPNYCGNASTVLPLFEKAGHPDWTRSASFTKNGGRRWKVEIGYGYAENRSYPMAVSLALLRAFGFVIAGK